MAPEIEIVHLRVRPGLSRELLEALQSVRETFLGSSTCTGVDILAGAGDDEMVLVISWISPDAHARAVAGSDARALFQRMSGLLSQPPATRLYVRTGGWKH